VYLAVIASKMKFCVANPEQHKWIATGCFASLAMTVTEILNLFSNDTIIVKDY